MGVKYILSSREVYSQVRLVRAIFLKVCDNNTPFVTFRSLNVLRTFTFMYLFKGDSLKPFRRARIEHINSSLAEGYHIGMRISCN